MCNSQIGSTFCNDLILCTREVLVICDNWRLESFKRPNTGCSVRFVPHACCLWSSASPLSIMILSWFSYGLLIWSGYAMLAWPLIPVYLTCCSNTVMKYSTEGRHKMFCGWSYFYLDIFVTHVTCVLSQSWRDKIDFYSSMSLVSVNRVHLKLSCFTQASVTVHLWHTLSFPWLFLNYRKYNQRKWS